MENPLEAVDIHRERFVWHPKVHEAANQRCHFLVYRLRRPRKKLTEALKGYLEAVGIKAFCVYFVYGYYDILVRCWSTTSQVRELQKIINIHLGVDIDDDESFEAEGSGVEYIKAKGNGEVQNWTLDQELLQGMEKGEGWKKEVQEKLEKQGLIHRVVKTQNSYIKFYMAFTDSSAAKSGKYDRSKLVELLSEKKLRENGITLKNVTLYEGKGFASVIVKGLVKSFDMIFTLNYHLAPMFLENWFRQTTFLVANRDAFESDQLIVGFDDWNQGEEKLWKLFEKRYPMARTRIKRSNNKCGRSVEILAQYGETLLGSRVEEYFVDLLWGGVLDNSLGDLTPEMLAGLEVKLAKGLRQAYSMTYGVDWQSVVASEGEKQGVDGRLTAYTLDVYAKINGVLLENSERLRANVEECIGENWFERWSAASEALAASEKSKEWKELAVAVCRSLQLYDFLLSQEYV